MMKDKKLRIRLLLILSLFEACLVVRVWQMEGKTTKPAVGFLVKNGSTFTIAWKEKGRDFQSRDYVRLQDAVSFASRELDLHEGINPFGEHELEHVWKSNRYGSSVVSWKSLTHSNVNQMSFQDENEANFFMQAFQRGSYAPSMFGHSILLVPHDSSFN